MRRQSCVSLSRDWTFQRVFAFNHRQKKPGRMPFSFANGTGRASQVSPTPGNPQTAQNAFKRAASQIVLGCAVGAAVLAMGYAHSTRPYSATVELLAFEQLFTTPAEAADFAAYVISAESMARFASRIPSSVTAESLASRCNVSIVEGQPSIRATVIAGNASESETLVGAFAEHVAGCVDDWISKRTKEADGQLNDAQHRLGELHKQFSEFDEVLLNGDIQTLQPALSKHAAEKSALVTSLSAQLTAMDSEDQKSSGAIEIEKPVLRNLRQELVQALSRYTDEHPKVKELRASINSLEKEGVQKSFTQTPQNEANATTIEPDSERGVLLSQLKSAKESGVRSREMLQKFAANQVAFTRLQAEYGAISKRRGELIQSRVIVASKGVEKWRRAEAVQLSRVTKLARLGDYAAGGALAGACIGLIGISMKRRHHRVIRTAAALESATGLPVMASLPDLQSLDENAREYWALETLELFRRSAGAKRRGSFVCGFISANSGEGCSTLMNLLAKAGTRNGHRVLVLSRPDQAGALMPASPEVPANALFALESKMSTESTAINRYSLVANATQVHFQKQWERAFTTWREEEDALILVELPPASTSDALLLSPALPNVVWLTAANSTESQEVTQCVTALRNTGCNLIGAALNRVSAGVRVAAALLLLCWLVTSSASGQEQRVSNDPTTNSTVAPVKPLLAPWQQRLTLGPGDVLDISLYSQSDSARSGIFIGPDGRISYLQARDVEATGLTIDELRSKLEGILIKFHLAPRVVIVPSGFHSKKYFMLGNVTAPGAFSLDRPLTIVEAVAKAKGFASGGGARSSLVLAELNHAFLVRRQPTGEFAREPVDFEKLFLRGDLGENKHLAPDDYLYFPPLGVPEVYVLGEAAGTGPVPYTKELTVLGAIASRGGFTDSAFRQKILVVRGSLQKPETFVIDSAKALRAASLDFLLQPRDIIYVSRKPWAKAEDLLKSATSDFARAAVITWTGREIEPLLK